MLKPSRLLLVTLLLLSACNTGVVIGTVDQRTIYNPNLVRYITRDGTLGVVVRGAPFGSSGDDAAPVVAAMSAPGWLGDVRMVPARDSDKDYRIVLIFGAGVGEPCASPPSPPPFPPGIPLHAQASFCAGRQLLSSLVASGPPATGPDDPVFHGFLDQVVGNLLSPTNTDAFRNAGGGGL